MANTYVGVSGKARDVRGWVGVDGVARKVVRGLVGVNGIARLFYESDFWTAGGISTANCLAAYQFKGAASETQALKDLTGHGYTLTKYTNTSGKIAAKWSATKGFYTDDDKGYWNVLKNPTLGSQNIKSIVVRYAGLDQSKTNGLCVASPKGSSGYAVLWADGANRSVSENFPGTSSGWTDNPIIKKSSSKILWANAKLDASGTVGMTLQTAIYKNGTSMNVTELNDTGYGGVEDGTYILVFPRTYNDFCLYSAAFYSVALTAAQHKAVADAMLKL